MSNYTDNMTQEMQDKIRKVAEYDGWVADPQDKQIATKGNYRQVWWLLTYHADIAALYPVAKSVCVDLVCVSVQQKELLDCPYMAAGHKIRAANNNFDIPALFESVYQGIVLLAQHNSITK